VQYQWHHIKQSPLQTTKGKKKNEKKRTHQQDKQ
jgi:hypothetical protein